MKKIKQTAGIILSLILLTSLFSVLPVYAAGKITIEVSTSSLNAGDTVKVTARASDDAGAKVSTDLKFTYDSSKLEFVKCSEEIYSGGAGGTVTTTASSASITLKAVAAGTASVSASSGSMTAAGAKLTINGEAENTAGKSPDNSLSSLKITPGTLSPEFSYSILNYTAEVAADVTNIEVDAKTTKEKAVVESITGNTDLKEGKNTVSIVVKAENGNTAAYKIVVNRGAASNTNEQQPPAETEQPTAGQGQITLNGSVFNLSAAIPDNIIPEGFTKGTVNCQGQEVEGLKSGNGAVTLVYLSTPDANVKNTLAVFEEASATIYPFRQVMVGDYFYIILNPPGETQLTGNYSPASIAIGGYEQISALTGDNAEYYLVYALAKSGNMGWYRYDGTEGSFQRYTEVTADTEGENTADTDMKSLKNAYDKLDENYTKQKDFSRKMMAVLIFAIAILMIVIANLLLRGKRATSEVSEENKEEFPQKRPSFFQRRKLQEDDREEELEIEETIAEPIEEFITESKVKPVKQPEVKPEKQPKIKPEKQPIVKPVKQPEVKPEKQPIVKPEKPEQAPVEQQPVLDELEDDFEVIDLDDL